MIEDEPEEPGEDEPAGQRELTQHDDDLANLLDRPSPKGISDRVRYDHAKQEWHYWDGIRWKLDATKHVYDMVARLNWGWLRAASSSAKAKVLTSLIDYGKKTAVLNSLAYHTGIAMVGDEWDVQPNLIGCGNGVLDLNTLEFYTDPHPEWLISRAVNVDWDPKAECPLFKKFVLEIMGGDEELMVYLLSTLGYALFGSQAEQKFWMWVGEGNNGKGTLAKTMSYIMGDYTAVISSELYMKTKMGASSSAAPRIDLVKLQGLRWTWMSEPQGGAFNDELVKAHTGDDDITARALYSNKFVSFRPTHTIVFLTNDPPRTEDVGPSMRRRARRISFEQDFSAEGVIDRTLETKFRGEAAGIFHLLALLAYNYAQNGLVEPAKVTQWSADYIESNDPLALFIQERCEMKKGASVSASLLYDAYVEWCSKRGDEPRSKTGFGLTASKRLTRVRTQFGNVYKDIKLLGAMQLAETTDDDT